MKLRSSLVVSGTIAFCAAVLVLACASADLKPLPVNEAGPPICATTAEIRCDASAPGLGTCVGDPDASTRAAMLPTDTAYAEGCQAFFRSNDCSSVASCECDGPEGGAAAWNCTR